jgi:glycosyltransferase involved in cell wall biosynthesis
MDAIRPQSTAGPRTAGFNLVGHLTTRMGLGTAARMTLGLIESRRWPAAVLDVHFRGLERTPLGSSAMVADFGNMPFSTTLLHMNPEQVMDGVLAPHPGLLGSLRERCLATVPYWELPILPDRWIGFLGGMDFVLAPSRFVEATLREALGRIPDPPFVSYYMQAVRPNRDVRPERARWFGARSDTTVFLASFDVVSDTARKNPAGVVEAFQAAAALRDDMTLVLKVGYSGSVEESDPFRQLLRSLEPDPRIILIEEDLSGPDMWSLLASADAYVSLHRAEGLGLGLMESMSLGTAVIGTGWSGNTDFMNAEDSILVPYELVPVRARTVPLYRELEGRASWAEPDLSIAAQAMRDLADSSELRERLGLAARASSERRWGEYSKAPALEALLQGSMSVDLADAGRQARLARLEVAVRTRRRVLRRARMRSESLLVHAKRAGVRALRAAGLKPPAPAHEAHVGPLEVVDPYELPVHREGGGRA